MKSFDDCVKIIQKWCDNEGVWLGFDDVISGHYFLTFHEELKGPAILISQQSDEEIQLFSLLHELGHYIIRKDCREDKWNESSNIESDKERIDLAREEVIAWEQAESIARELNVWHLIDTTRWDTHLRECLFGYMSFAVDPSTI